MEPGRTGGIGKEGGMEGLFTKRCAALLLSLIRAPRGISPSCLVLPFNVFLCALAASYGQVLTQGGNPRVCAHTCVPA